MILHIPGRQSHCTAATCWLKPAILLSLLVAAAPATTQQTQPGQPDLRRELMELLQSGRPQGAIARAQQALRQAPDDPEVRREFVRLHLALARDWLSRGRFDDCLAAVAAVLAVQPNHEEAGAIREHVLAAREEAGTQLPTIDQLLRLELFESALGRIREVKALRPDLTATLAGRERAAWLGAADDHYTAGNFSEAFALYEHVLSLAAVAPRDIAVRWSTALALALVEDDLRRPLRADLAAHLLARAADVTPATEELRLRTLIAGLLAERNGRYLEAGRHYAGALGLPWQLPPADQRRSAVAELRSKAARRLYAFVDQRRARPRAGPWQYALPDVWKSRQTAHFAIYARNDLVAARLAEAAEFHFAGLSAWLGVQQPDRWEPRCELRIHATLGDFHKETGTDGGTHALTQTRMQGNRVLLRRIDLFQNDPWLLSSTLPHELTHLLLAEMTRSATLPLVLDTGLALQAEPPARRLQFRRLLSPIPPEPTELLTLTSTPADELVFYAGCDVLTGWLLWRAGLTTTADSSGVSIAALIDTFRGDLTPAWWQRLGWGSRQEMQRDWAAWHAERRDPPRMPLMMLAEASSRSSPGE